MNDESGFRHAMLACPNDTALRLIFADWLEERGDLRAELLRLLHELTQSIDVPQREEEENQLRSLLESGVEPVGPFFTNSIGMKFAWVPPGTFLMGSPEEENERSENETQHKVTLTKGFCLGVHAVTQRQWQAVMGNNPSHFVGETNLPVETISWDDCQVFITRLREKDKKPYRLPTEAEWEYACRAGTTTPFHFGLTISTDRANYNGNFTLSDGKNGEFRAKTTSVGNFRLANAFGLFDMHGNLWEWCQDWDGDYPQNEVNDPPGAEAGEYRVLRGGSWFGGPGSCRSASRGGGDVSSGRDVYGCRLCFCLG